MPVTNFSSLVDW